MEHSFTTQGIVLNKTEFGESSYTLKVFSSDFGLIYVNAKGAKRPKSKINYLTGLYSYSEMELYKGSGNNYTLTGGNLIDSFYGISENYDNYKTAGDITQIICNTLQKDLPEKNIMKLYITALYVLSVGKKQYDFIRTCFDIRFLTEQGILPENDKIVRIFPEKFIQDSLSARTALEAVTYIRNCDIGKVFSFTVSEDVLKELKIIDSYFMKEVL